jgi:hypothetical protein
MSESQELTKTELRCVAIIADGRAIGFTIDQTGPPSLPMKTQFEMDGVFPIPGGGQRQARFAVTCLLVTLHELPPAVPLLAIYRESARDEKLIVAPSEVSH